MAEVGRPDRRRLGAAGERVAARYLRRRGYRILHRGYRCPLGELDLVAVRDATLVFIEVKTRRSRAFGPPEAAVTPAKQAKLRRLGEYFLTRHAGDWKAVRFDVLAVELRPWRPARVRHVENALP